MDEEIKECYVWIRVNSVTYLNIFQQNNTQKFSTVLVLAGTDSDKFSLTGRVGN